MQKSKMISINNFPKKPADKNIFTNFLEILKISYYTSLVGGIILCVSYFTVYAGGIPSLSDISQLLGLLIATCSIAFVMTCYITFIMVMPSTFILSLKLDQIYIKHIQSTLFIFNCVIFYAILYSDIPREYQIYLVASLLLVCICFSFYFINEKTKDEKKFQYFLILVEFTCTIVLYHYSARLYVLLILLILQFIHLLFIYTKKIKINFFFIIIYTIFLYIFTLLLMYLFLLPTDNNYLFLVCFFIVITGTNFFVLQISKKNIFLSILFIVLTTIVIFTLSASLFNRPNPLITAPFTNLKLGYYPAELRFKEEFIKNTNFFNMKDRNITSNVFFILNSIGDEYIVRERSPIFFLDDNISLFAIDHKNRLYWYGKDENNNTKIYTFKDFHFQLTDEVNASTLKETFDKDKTKKYTNTQVYRIKKEDVIYETNGKGVDDRNTTVYGLKLDTTTSQKSLK